MCAFYQNFKQINATLVPAGSDAEFSLRIAVSGVESLGCAVKNTSLLLAFYRRRHLRHLKNTNG